MTLGVGDAAPPFTLPGTDGTGAGTGHRDYSLDEFRGLTVVLVFYPADASPVCTVQLNSYTADIEAFDDVGAQVLAISPQRVEDHDRFAAANGGFGFPLLADEDKAVGEAYGVLGPVGFYRRSIVVVDGDGIVRWTHRATAGFTFRPASEIAEAVAALDSSEPG